MKTNRQPTILVVDDEPKIRRLVESYLERAGYRTESAADGSECLRRFRAGEPDLVILDLGLPSLDGMDVARVIRRESSVPIIMLTARADEGDKLDGLGIGADDYVTKPFSPRELVARVGAVLRRTGEPPTAPVPAHPVTVQDIEIDTAARQASRSGSDFALTSYQFDLLALLASHAGQVLSREQLIAMMHDDSETPFDRTVDAHIKNLRRILGDDPTHPRYIETIRGVGYRFRMGT